MIFVEICVLLDVVTQPSAWSDWSARTLVSWSERGALGINDLVLAEFCAGDAALSQGEAAIEAMSLDVLAFPREALVLASNAHRSYRRRGGNRASALPES